MTRVFVGNLPMSVQERELESEFDKFGRIRSISVKFPQRPPPFAFIEYEDERDASDAVRSMHGREFHGSRLRVEISHGGGGGGAVRGGEGGLESRLRGTQFRVKVSNLPIHVSWQDLKDFLRDGGDVAHTDVDRRGNGVASFATFEDMDRAIHKLDDTELFGERIRIREVGSLFLERRSEVIVETLLAVAVVEDVAALDPVPSLDLGPDPALVRARHRIEAAAAARALARHLLPVEAVAADRRDRVPALIRQGDLYLPSESISHASCLVHSISSWCKIGRTTSTA